MIEIPGYHIVRQLGRGGMSTVYLAIQQSVDREVALKVMSPALLVDPDFGTRFLREARIAARLHHRHVVGIHDVGHAGDLHYIAMEYVPGGPLPCGDGKPLPPAQALRIAREIAGALAYAHDRGIVHRDVKPDNILLREDGSAVLTDFGIAHAQEAALRMTRTGAIVGTPHYMSPEQARGRGVDGRSDLYSLGVVLYEMLLGQVPYRAGDSLAVGIMHISEPLPRLPTRLAALQGLLDRLLAKEPAQRYQHGNEVAAAIDALEQAQPPWAEPAEVPPLPGPLRARSATPLDDLAPMFAVDRSTDAVPERTPDGRSEPSLGRIDELGADVDAPALRAQRERIAAPTPQRARSGRWLALGALLLMATLAWWNQDTLRHLLPRTSFNDTLSRAQQALDAGHLTGNQGDSARELFLAARAQDPDNDIARNGLEAVARRLLERGQQALAEDDLAAARSDLDAARELLGGGVAVDQLAQAIRQRDSQRDTQDATARSLDAAAAALAAGRLVGDDGAAALYQRVLDGDAGNAIAQAGLRKCADELATQARTALAGGDIEGAVARSDDIARILPGYPGQTELLADISRARETARAAREAQLQGLLDRADASAQQGQLSGNADAALELYRQAAQLDPANARVQQGLRRVAQALLVRATAAIDDDNALAAARFIDEAAAIAPDLPDLRVARGELRELRERLDIAAHQQPLTPAQGAQVQRLVAAGERAAQAGQLMEPPGISAYDRYRAALAIDADSTAARDGLARLPAIARDLFARAISEGAPQRARGLLDVLRELAPEDPALPALSARLANAFLDQADQRIGEGRREDATRLLDAARGLDAANPRLAPLQQRLDALLDAHG